MSRTNPNAIVSVSLNSSGSAAAVAARCVVATGFMMRLKGLIGRRRFSDGEGMLFPQCNDIHMWFMSVPIDVVFIKPREGSLHEVCSTREALKPWRVIPVHDGRARDTLELPAGTVRKHNIVAGDILCIA